MHLLAILVSCILVVPSVFSAVKIVQSQFIYETAPFPECHASTICESSSGLVAAWFGGTREKHKDVCIYVSSLKNGKWTAPREVANGEQDGMRYPTWNPVLFQPEGGPLLLFYKVGPSPSDWWGMMKRSDDGGETWSEARKLPEGYLGPIKNKPIQLPDGSLLHGSSTEHDGWVVHMERSHDRGREWEKTGKLNDLKEFGAIQPTILFHAPDKIQILCRATKGFVTESWSSDLGKTWTPMKPTKLPNPNSGLDAVKLSDGRSILIYNHVPKGRSPLNVGLSKTGVDWDNVLALETEPGEFSYPAVIQAKDGKVHVTYTWKRKKIKHVILDAAAPK